MKYNSTHIYYMSGTGNTYRVSKFIEKIIMNSGAGVSVHSVSGTNPKLIRPGGKENLIGIMYPTHGFTMPWGILKFVFKMPAGNGTGSFIIATRGSLKFGKVHIPGLSGTGTFIIALILFAKGYNVRGVMSVNMPSNWSALHPIQKRQSHNDIICRSKKKILEFAAGIFAGKKVWFNLNNLYEFTFGLILSPVSLGYLLIGRFFLGKLYFANNNCRGCGLCAKNCPFDAIRFMGRKKIPYWTYHCESCMRCTFNCPNKAIEMGQSWGVLMWALATIPVSVYILKLLDNYIPGIIELKRTWVKDVLDFLYWYPAMFISYLIFNLLLKIPVVNWIFTHTTLTHFKFWGRYFEPNTKVSELTEKS